MSVFNYNPTDSRQIGAYDTGLGITNTYDFFPGNCILPLAEDPPTTLGELKLWSPVIQLQLHAPYRIRKVKYDSQKSNNPPIMPAPASVGAFTFLGGTVLVTNQMNSTSVGFDWHVTSVYNYVELCVSRPEDGLVLGTPPWVWSSSLMSAQTVPVPATSNMVGAVVQAGAEVLMSKSLSDTVQFDQLQGSNASTYLYNMPSFYPGNFFNWFVVNGGLPTAGF